MNWLKAEREDNGFSMIFWTLIIVAIIGSYFASFEFLLGAAQLDMIIGYEITNNQTYNNTYFEIEKFFQNIYKPIEKGTLIIIAIIGVTSGILAFIAHHRKWSPFYRSLRKEEEVKY